MNIEGKQIILRAMEPEDMELLREMINDPEIERMVGGWSFPLSRVEQQRWYERAIGDRNNLRFIIEMKKEHKAVGMANLVNIDWKNRSAFHGVKLSRETPKGKGIATDAMMTILQYAFEELQLVRVDSTIAEYNEASIALCEKCGWKVEGKKEKSTFCRGQYFSNYVIGILDTDFQEAKTRLGW